MISYALCINNCEVGVYFGVEVAYKAYRLACGIIDLYGKGNAYLVDDNTGEVIAYYDPEADDEENF